MYILIKISTLKELYKTNRKLREQNERYLRIIDRWRLEREEEEILCKGTDRYKGLFNFIF